MTLPLSQLQELIGDLSNSQSQESDLLLMQLDAVGAHRLRLCAIPHTFDVEVLCALDPLLTAEDAERTLEEFQQLPAVMQLADCFALHDVVRHQLFAQWLTAGRREEFAAASQRLVDLYSRRPDESATSALTRQSSRLFHLLGADLGRGFEEFQSIYQVRRDQGRFGDCQALLRLLSEYEPVLGSHESAWLAYYRAEIADDNRNWPQAVELIDTLLKQGVPDELRPRALLRSASVLRRLGRFEQARARLTEALERGAAPHLVHLELGLIARDDKDMDRAREELERAVELAKASSNPRDIVFALNSLGTLLLQVAPRDAAKLFYECLALLDREKDTLRIANVLNNLGMANANFQEWQASETYYGQSLEIKRAARDIYGEASTLLNVARVYRAEMKWDQAQNALETSAKLFGDAHDPARVGQVFRELARLMNVCGRTAEAEAYARRAIESLQRAGNETDAQAVRLEFDIAETARRKRRWLIWSAAILGLLVVLAIVIIALQ